MRWVVFYILLFTGTTTIHQTITNIETQYNFGGGQTIIKGDQTNIGELGTGTKGNL